MPKFEPQTRFLLRGSALVIGLLTLWWFVLVGPMLYMLKSAAGSFVWIQENPSGDWTLRVPLEKTLPVTSQRSVPVQIHSIDFDMLRSDVITFTFSLPVFWAIILAAPRPRRNLGPLLWGTAVMSMVELILLLLFAQITAHNAASQLAGAQDTSGKWIRHLGEYLVVNVLPYAVPFVVALSLHRDLRGQVFAFATEADRPSAHRIDGRISKKQERKLVMR